MIKTILFYFILFALSVTTTMAASKTEVELKVALTKVGYDGLKKTFIDHFEGQSSERTDTYFDMIQNGRYVLQALEQPVKLRLMLDGEKLKWQNQKIIKTGSRSIFSIKTTEASELQLPYDRPLFESLDDYFLKLKQLDPYALIIADTIQNFLVSKKLITSSGLLTVATHSNHKKRVKIKLHLENDQFNIQVGETNNQGVISYEMEAEVKIGSDLFKSADRLNNWLQSQGFNSTHIDISVPVNPTESGLILLTQILRTQY